MVEIVITESAWSDLDAIEDYIALDSPRYARLWVEKLLSQIAKLGQYKLAGRIVPEFQDKTIREKIFRGYRIVYYLPSPDRIEVVRVVRGSKPLI